MKKQNIITILFLSLITFSCSSDSDNLPPANPIKSLYSIKKEFYSDGNLEGFFIQNYENKKLIGPSNLYEITYNGDLVTQILKHESDYRIQSASSYQYDNLGRMVLKKGGGKLS